MFLMIKWTNLNPSYHRKKARTPLFLKKGASQQSIGYGDKKFLLSKNR